MSAHGERTLNADPVEAAHARELRRVKALATAVLVAAIAVLVVAKILAPRYPAFGFVAAFAEAAAIGGIADWYAVVALFRRPLGLPIPHTAVIQRNRDRIAEKFGEFIELHFLADGPVYAKLREVEFGRFAAEWLGDRTRSGELARFLLRMLPDALSAAETSGLTVFLTRRLAAWLQTLDIAPLAAGLLRATVGDQRHKRVFDDLVFALHKTLLEPRTLAAILAKIRSELPTLLRFYRADEFLLRRIMGSLQSFLREVYDDPAHPFRGEFDRAILALADRMEHDPAYAKRLKSLVRASLTHERLADIGGKLWPGLKRFLERAAAAEGGVLAARATDVLVEVGRQLGADADLRREIDDGCVVVLRSFVASQKTGVSQFIGDQVKAWDMNRMVTLLELNIGKDLQYIRFNGTLIGGLAGLALYCVQLLFGLA